MAFRALICISGATVCLLSAWPAVAQTADFIIARDGKAEEAFCTQVTAAEQTSCIVTRDYVAVCKALVNKEIAPILLPAFPAKTFDVKYLRPDEKPIVLVALQQSNAALDALIANDGKGSAGK